MEYSYDPETGEFHARIVDPSEPVVTRWDSPPEQTERPVGTFDVTPTEGGVQAEETGERATSTEMLRYQHDLDSGETDYRAPRRSPAELAAIIQRRNQQRDNGGTGEMSAKYQMAAKHLERPLVAAGPHQVLTPDETARPSGHRRVAALRELHKLGRVSEKVSQKSV